MAEIVLPLVSLKVSSMCFLKNRGRCHRNRTIDAVVFKTSAQNPKLGLISLCDSSVLC